MAIGDYDAINRAARVLRVLPEPGWDAIEDDVIAAVRSTPRGGWPLLVEDPLPDTAPGIIRVSELVLGTLLSRALAGDADFAVTDIRIGSDESVLQSVSIELSGRYHADLPSAAERAHTRSLHVVAEIIGDMPGLTVEVTVTDVHR